MDKISSRVNKGKLIQAALIKTARNKYKNPYITDHRIDRDCVINLFQEKVFYTP